MPKPTRIVSLLAGLCAALALAGPAAAQSEAAIKANIAKLKPKDFPSQPIELTVVYPAGGGMDINARLLQKYFEKWSGEKAIVNNRTGGAGMVGHTYLATQAKPDGHTVGVIATLLLSDSMLRAQGKWNYRDLEPLVFLNLDAMFLIVSTEGPFKDKSLKEIAAMAKAKPNSIRITVGGGTSFDFLTEQIEANTGARFLKVPFQGGAPGVAALLGGNVDVAIAYFGEFRGQLDAKKVNLIGVTSSARSPLYPNVPTTAEVFNAKEMTWETTRWTAVPKGVPADRKAWLVAALDAAARDPELAKEFGKLGMVTDPRPGTPQALNEHIERAASIQREFFTKTGRLK